MQIGIRSLDNLSVAEMADCSPASILSFFHLGMEPLRVIAGHIATQVDIAVPSLLVAR